MDANYQRQSDAFAAPPLQLARAVPYLFYRLPWRALRPLRDTRCCFRYAACAACNSSGFAAQRHHATFAACNSSAFYRYAAFAACNSSGSFRHATFAACTSSRSLRHAAFAACTSSRSLRHAAFAACNSSGLPLSDTKPPLQPAQAPPKSTGPPKQSPRRAEMAPRVSRRDRGEWHLLKPAAAAGFMKEPRCCSSLLLAVPGGITPRWGRPEALRLLRR